MFRFSCLGILLTALNLAAARLSFQEVPVRPVALAVDEQAEARGAVRHAILLADQLEAYAERTLDTGRLADAYDGQALDNALATVENLRSKGQYRVAALKSVEFREMAIISEDEARAETVEWWQSSLYLLNGRRIGYRDGNEAVPQISRLRRREGAWRVVGVEFLPHGERPPWRVEPPLLTGDQVVDAVVSRPIASNALAFLDAARALQGIATRYDGEGEWRVKVRQFNWRVDDSTAAVEAGDERTLSFEQGVLHASGDPPLRGGWRWGQASVSTAPFSGLAPTGRDAIR